MHNQDPLALAGPMREYFDRGQTLELGRRAAALRRLRAELIAREAELCEAVSADFGRSAFDTVTCELMQVQEEIDTALRNLAHWAAPQKAEGGLWNLPSCAAVCPQPRGVVLILSPWNYPILLALAPLVGAVAAGNCVLLRPSQRTANTARALEGLLRASFPAGWAAAVLGGHAVSDRLLTGRFDLIFFTGSAPVGRRVMRAAAEHLTPVVLELGGKSPCIVDETAEIESAARRIVWGKFLNAGQTCVAPDYLLVQRPAADRLAEALCREIGRMGYDRPGALPQIITEEHTRRIAALIAGERVIAGGGVFPQERRLEPTLLYPVSPDAPCMCEEIFGPVLPVLVCDTLDEAVALIRSREQPLALYHFSRDPARIRRVLRGTSAGGGCVNDVILHAASAGLPFGGVGMSGMGRYHGKASFDLFSNPRSLLLKPARLELPLRYPPHSAWKERAVSALFRRGANG